VSCQPPIGCICLSVISHEARGPPREGVRSWSRGADGSQRQGPHRRLRPRLERAEPPARPITRAFLDVLQALLWQFHNAHTGSCFPSYTAIATKAGCARSTVAEALKALEWAGVLTWQHRITRIRERCTDLFGRISWRWRVIRTSNAYVFYDPKAIAASFL
jgi:hypothetical protein